MAAKKSSKSPSPRPMNKKAMKKVKGGAALSVSSNLAMKSTNATADGSVRPNTGGSTQTWTW